MVKYFRKSFSFSDLWVTSNDKLSDFYASSWQRGDSPIPLLVVRFILCACAVGILAWSVAMSPSPTWLVFLTNWGLVLVSMLTLSALIVSFAALSKKTMDGDELPWYVSMYWLIFNITITIAFLITVLYWILLYDPEPEEPDTVAEFWLDVATHGFNSCIAAVEVLVSRTPVRFLHIYQPLAVGLWYAAFSAIFYAAGGLVNDEPYIYEVLDWRQGSRAGSIVAIAMAGLLAIYTLLWGVGICRDKISTTWIRTRGHDLPVAPPDRHMIV